MTSEKDNPVTLFKFSCFIQLWKPHRYENSTDPIVKPEKKYLKVPDVVRKWHLSGLRLSLSASGNRRRLEILKGLCYARFCDYWILFASNSTYSWIWLKRAELVPCSIKLKFWHYHFHTRWVQIGMGRDTRAFPHFVSFLCMFWNKVHPIKQSSLDASWIPLAQEKNSSIFFSVTVSVCVY